MYRSRQVVLLLALLAVGVAVFRCQVSAAPELKPYRCLEDLDLHELMTTVGIPQVQSGGWGVASVKVALEGKVFDLEQEATIEVDEASTYVSAMCRQLELQLSRRCHVRKYWAGLEHCSTAVESPSETGQDGVYKNQGVIGRVSLFASPAPDGKVRLVLVGSEWAG